MRVMCLEGALLDFWVAKSEGMKVATGPRQGEAVTIMDPDSGAPRHFRPSQDWSQAGPIITDDWYSLEDVLAETIGPQWPFHKAFRDDPLKWLMRAYVTTKFGDEVEDLDSTPKASRSSLGWGRLRA